MGMPSPCLLLVWISLDRIYSPFQATTIESFIFPPLVVEEW